MSAEPAARAFYVSKTQAAQLRSLRHPTMADPSPEPSSARLVSIILPTLNEEHIGDALVRLANHLLSIEDHRFEIFLVDDSSAQNREQLRAHVAGCTNWGPRIEISVIDGDRKGKGSAVRKGAMAAHGQVSFVIDADLPVPLFHIDEFLQVLEHRDRDIVIGERPMTRDLSRPLRLLLSRVLSVFVHAVVFQSTIYSDTQCGFKGFRTEVLQSLAKKQSVDGGMYDVEYLYVAGLEHRKVMSTPVELLPETRPSKINVMKCLYTDPLSLIGIKARGIFGAYR